MAAKPIPVRLSDNDIENIDKAAAQLGLTSRTDLIKIAITALINHVQETGGLYLPANWKDILESMDGRTKKSTKKGGVSHG